ncbi:MAG: Gx transporter family protein [Clostridia bacterium]|nr:Gx transporter family protein [Clostridia bacterium]MBR5767659.1 Gx transporter family protein [Clostridia bacterium]
MSKTKKAAALGVFTALALALSYLEFILPMSFIPLPGFKPGLANVAVMAALYLFGLPEAALVSALRTVLSLFMFSNINAFLYSLAGAALSLTVMYLMKKAGIFSEIGVSVTGAVFHNLGQTAVACAVLRSSGIWLYFPLLVIAGAVTGVINGLIVKLSLRALSKSFFRPADGEEDKK